MLKKIFVFLFPLFLLAPLAQAQMYITLCSPVGPIFCADPLQNNSTQNFINQQQQQQAEIQQNIDNLKALYGANNYYACLPQNYYSSGMAGDPWYDQVSYNQTKSCLEQKEIAKQQPPPVCPAGTAWYSGQCTDDSLICQEKFGPNTYTTGNLDSSGKFTCDCKPGFVSNQTGTACVQQPPINSINGTISQIRSQIRTETQACQQAYGLNSEPYHYPDGSAVCRCKTGYQFNNKTTCVAISQQPAGISYSNQGGGSVPNPTPPPAAPTTPTTPTTPTAQPKIKTNKQNVAKPKVPAPALAKVRDNIVAVQPAKPQVLSAHTATPIVPAVTNQPNPSFFQHIVNWFKNLF